MSGDSRQQDHPSDALPDFVRGCADDPDAVARHLSTCPACRLEVQILRAVVESGPEPISELERERVFRTFDERRARPGGGGGSAYPRWRGTTWRAAAAIALIFTSVGIWQVVEHRPGSSDWSPEAALEAWQLDLAELEVGPADIRVAFGPGALGEIGWEDLEGLDPYEIRAPWEEN